MKNKFLNTALLGMVLFVNFYNDKVNAGIIGVCGADAFEDKGIATIDCTQNLEWLDVTETMQRSYRDVLTDINSDTDAINQFAIADGWRFATAIEFITLVNGFFNIGLTESGPNSTFLGSNPLNGYEEVLLTEQFISLFGDTRAAHEQNIGGTKDFSIGGGFITGYLAPFSSRTLYGKVSDWEYCCEFFGIQDQSDFIEYDTYIDVNAATQVHVATGSFLVRSVIQKVPEPSTLAIFSLGMIGLASRRFKKQ